MCVRAATVMDVPAGGLLEDRIDRAWFFAGRPPTPAAPAQQQQQQRQPPQHQASGQLPSSSRSGGLQQQQRLGVVAVAAAVDDGSDSLETSSVVAESIGSRVRCGGLQCHTLGVTSA